MLIQGSGSSPAWRVMITLEEKSLEWTSKQCDFSKSEALWVLAWRVIASLPSCNFLAHHLPRQAPACVMADTFVLCIYVPFHHHWQASVYATWACM